MRNYFEFCSAAAGRMFLPKRLVFTGGGTRCIVFADALLLLEKAGALERVEEYWGTSAGAFLATLMALSDSGGMEKVRELMHTTDYIKFRDVDINNLLAIHKVWGLDSGISLVEEVERILELIKPGAKDFKMSDIPGLTIVISNLSTHTVVLCSAKTYPSLRVVDAIRASMSLPLFFRPYVHEDTGHIWVDGAVGANFPWMLVPSHADRKESLGFTFDHGDVKTPATISQFIFSMIHFEGPKKKDALKTYYPKNILWFPNLPFPAWFMKLTSADFEMLASIGKKVAEDWLSSFSEHSYSHYPQGKNGSSHPYGDHRNPSPAFPPHHTEQTSDNPKSSVPEPPRDSSPPQSHCTPPSCRRWSW
jgi:NTE family protein